MNPIEESIEQPSAELEIKIKAYCLGARADRVCKNLTNEVFGIEWIFRPSLPISTKELKIELVNPPLFIIITDLNKKNELENTLQIAQIALELDIHVVVFSVSTIQHKSNEALINKLGRLIKIVSIIQLEEDADIPHLFVKNNYDGLTLSLLWKLRALIEPITIEQLPCVDYADIRWALNNKGFCQNYVSFADGKNRTTMALSNLLAKLSKQTIAISSGIIITLFAGIDYQIEELEQIMGEIIKLVKDDDDYVIILGLVIDLELENKRLISAYLAG